jgi:Prokaryotic N-terminal methylation motif
MNRRRISDFGFRISDFRPRRPGFTLIELMVSVALAIIIITLFSTIYSWSMETYSSQKGIRRNDQRSRMLVTVIKGDLNNRTFRDVVPFWPGQTTASATGRYVPGERRGYFCISENDPENDTDDVLFLTIEIPNDNSQRAYHGRAKVLFDATVNDPRTGNPYTDDATGWARYLIDHPNQPEHDDGQVNVAGGMVGILNNAGQSRAAEVAYFLRNGNLYRRVLLIRDPYDETGSSTGAQPPLITGLYSAAIVRNNTGDGLGYFWRDFAYSAYYRPAGVTPGVNPGPRFHGLSALDNLNGPGVVTDPDSGNFPLSLGIPPLRFGYSLNRGAALQLLPREYADPTPANQKFFGRFLADETAHSDFLYPGQATILDPVTMMPIPIDPHVRTDLTLNATTQMIDQYYGYDNSPVGESTAHRGEDILMTHVHSFDVKVWDRTLNQFVDLGHTMTSGATNGEFHRLNNRRAPGFPGTDPDRFAWNRFDTWHPYATAAAAPLGEPPYRTAANTTLGDPGEPVLLAIQITIRFFDVSTKQMRQLTIQHSLKK